MDRRRLTVKKATLEGIVREMGGFALAFSGGVDSSFLLAVAVSLPGVRVLAATADSSTYPSCEKKTALAFAASLGAEHRLFLSEELDIRGFAANPPGRCYHCKNELFGKLAAIAREARLPWVADGSNVDDLKDYRPGRAARERWGVRSPLEEAGLSKEEIRFLSREMGLPDWKRPAQACLASRFPYGTEITREKLKVVERAEEALRGLGIAQVRVRHHGDLARVEIDRCNFGEAVLRHREEIVEIVKRSGFLYVALDLEGYRTGSMNEGLAAEDFSLPPSPLRCTR